MVIKYIDGVWRNRVTPLYLLPGPDILFVSSLSLPAVLRAALKANMGVGWVTVCTPFWRHSLAAAVVASLVLLNGMRWFGVAHIAYLLSVWRMSAMQ